MATSAAKLTSKHQITIPVAVRRRLGLKEGDWVYLDFRGDDVMLRAAPGGWVEATRGLGADVWKEAGGAAAIDRERQGWDDR